MEDIEDYEKSMPREPEEIETQELDHALRALKLLLDVAVNCTAAMSVSSAAVVLW